MKIQILKSMIVLVLVIAFILFFLAAREEHPYWTAGQAHNRTIETFTQDTGEIAEETLLERFIDFDSLREINPDIIAWIYIPGTLIDYPVVRGGDMFFYLNHRYDRNPCILGAIFVHPETSDGLTDAHMIMHGHNMISGQKFGQLSNYTHLEFKEDHPYIYIYTPHRNAKAEVLFGRYVSALSNVYKVDLRHRSMEYRDWILEHVTPFNLHQRTVAHEDSIITLSTCTNAGNARYRFIVQGVIVEARLVEG